MGSILNRYRTGKPHLRSLGHRSAERHSSTLRPDRVSTRRPSVLASACHRPRGRTTMIIEMRTYTLQPGTLAEVEKRFGASLPVREKHSKLAAFWHTDVGPLNQIIHVWTYDSFEQRAAVRAAATKDEGWPPPIREFVTNQQSEVFHPAPFCPPLTPRQVGPLFEIRQYTLIAGAIPGLIERWSEKIEGRTKFS